MQVEGTAFGTTYHIQWTRVFLVKPSIRPVNLITLSEVCRRGKKRVNFYLIIVHRRVSLRGKRTVRSHTRERVIRRNYRQNYRTCYRIQSLTTHALFCELGDLKWARFGLRLPVFDVSRVCPLSLTVPSSRNKFVNKIRSRCSKSIFFPEF